VQDGEAIWKAGVLEHATSTTWPPKINFGRCLARGAFEEPYDIWALFWRTRTAVTATESTHGCSKLLWTNAGGVIAAQCAGQIMRVPA
jgi:hypothetical protein